MKLMMISGDGQGTGKTFLARKITDNQAQIFSIVNVIRSQLQLKFPQYDQFNKELDDIRFVDEYKYIRESLLSENFLHLHISYDKAKPEPLYENEKLRLLADYIIVGQKQLSSRIGVQ